MIYHASCRDAKTAEEYMLRCLFKAEDERDEAVAYCEVIRQAEEERIKAAEEAQKELEEKAKNAPVFEVKETKTVKYKVARAYQFCDKDYGLADVKTLTDALNLDDEKLYEWACKSYSGEKDWYSFRPITRTEKTFDYMLAYYGDDETDLQVFVSEEGWPENFEYLMPDRMRLDRFCPIAKDSEIKALAIINLREELKEAVSRLSKVDGKGDGNE